MGLFRQIAEQRDKQIRSHASAHLTAGEEVLQWARARHPTTGDEGFVYLTKERCLVHWVVRPEEDRSIDWREIRSWGVNKDGKGGPILALEGDSESVVVQLPVVTKAMAFSATRFVRRVALLAPEAAGSVTRRGRLGLFKPEREVQLLPERRSFAGHSKRVVVTVIGVSLVLVGIALLVLPGPGILVTIAGLAVLSSEYDWAKDTLYWMRSKYKQTRHRFQSRDSGR